MNEDHDPATTPPASSPSRPLPGAPCDRCGAPLAPEAPCAACILEGALDGAPQGAVGATTSSGLPSGAFLAPSVETVAEALPAYEIQILVGQGGMGAVYRARHRKLDRMVAIKVLRPMELNDPAQAADFTERFEREARVLAKLDHPHIVRIYDFGRTETPEPFFYLVLEFVDGTSLRQLMAEGRLSPKEVLELIPQVCEALQTAHSLGVIHRDIKPENILVDGDGRVRIADFGLAKLRGPEPEGWGLTRSDQALGTVHYMAPEQLRVGSMVDHRADLYSLGVVVYEMLTGELPLGRFAAPSEKAEIDTDLDDVIFRALENEPEERYQDAGELKQDLVDGEPGRGQAPQPTGAEPKGQTKPMAGSRRRRKRRNRPRVPASASQEDSVLYRSAMKKKQRRDAADQTRSWIVLGALAVSYSMTWIELPIHTNVRNELKNRLLSLASGLGDTTFSVGGGDVKAMGFPLWLGFIGILAAAILRTLESNDLRVDYRIPIGLGAIGTVLVLWVLAVGLTESFWVLGAAFEPGYVFALLVYVGNSAMDLGTMATARAVRSFDD